LLSLLYDPVPSFGAFDYYGLMGGALLSALTDGNGYWIKQRDNADRVRELWWVPHTNIEPVRLDPRKPDYLYLYRVWIEGEPKPIDQLIEPRDIVHFKWGSPDTDNDLKACAPLKRCLKEVASDGQVASYTSSILWNMGVPGLLMIFQDRKQVSEDQAEELKAKMKRVFGGRKRGDSAVLAGPVTIEKPGFSPDEMALTEIGKIPEARICAAIGVPPMILGLSVGDEQRSYANYAAAEKVAWRRLRSVQGRMAEAIYRQLLPDFAQDRADLRIGWDYTNVEALQEDRDAAARRSVLLYKGRVAKRAEARKMVGLPVAEDGSDDVYDSAPAPMIAAKSESSTNSGVMNGRGSQADGVPTSDDRGAESETNGKRIGMLGGHVPGGNGQGHHGSEGGDYLSVGRWSMGITPQERFGFLRGFDGAEHGGSHKGEGNGAGNGLGDGGSGSGPELAPGQPAWPAQWEADHEPDAEDVPGASDGVQGKAIVDWRDGGGNIMDGEPGPHAGDGGTPGSDQLECKDSRGVDATAVEVCDGSGSGDHQGVEGGASR
jgi:HK97 family phage portal protein